MEGIVPKTAFLVYKTWREARRKDSSWDNLSQIGPYMLIDTLMRAGIKVEFCSADSAKNYELILVSLTSNYDILAFAREVFGHPEWKNRKFKVAIGGFGAQNPYPIQEYIDYVWFGRAENEIVWLVKNRFDVEHPSLMKLPNWKVCKINQSDKLYPYPIQLHTKAHGKEEITETIYGCPNKCFYCHYTWARKYIHTSEHYQLKQYSSSQELDMFNIEQYDPKVARVLVGLDGYSERLRYIVNRKITNENIREFVEGISNRTETKGNAIVLKMYNITGYETETDADYQEFVDLLNSNFKLKKRVLLVVHNTPLHPSPCTPIAYAKINMRVNVRKHYGKPIVDKPLLNAFYSHYQETDYGLLESLVVERAQASTQKIFIDIVFNKKLKQLLSDDKIKALSMKHDLTPLYREYSVHEKLPTWFIEGYMPQDAIRKLRLQMLKKQGRLAINN